MQSPSRTQTRNGASFLRVSSQDAVENPRWYLVDIRPLDERKGSIGYVPGSRAVPTESIVEDLEAFASSVEKSATVVFVCASGRRSAILAEQLAGRVPQTLATLEGGTLGWTAAGLPTCGLEPPATDAIPMVPSIDKFPRALLACFAAESIENTLDGRVSDEIDANEVIQQAIAGACAGKVSARCLEVVLERVSEIARRSGFKLSRIRENTDAFTAAIDRLKGADHAASKR